LKRCDPSKAKRWLTFLNNHREVTAALDFFTVPTPTFRVLYCFFVIEHSHRKILHSHATAHPTSEWIVQQLREAFSLLAFTDMSSSITMRSSVRQSASS
jgi:rRNA maturation protein Rpf1